MTIKYKRAQVPKIQEVTDEVGLVYKTNNCGDIVVLEYDTSKRIKIEFVDTGNQYVVQKDALEKGLIKDKIKWLQEIADRDNSIREEKERVRKEEFDRKLHVTQAKQEEVRRVKLIKLAEAERVRVEVAEKKSLEKLQSYKDLLGQKYSHDYFGEYEIVDFDLDKHPMSIRVKFTISGCDSWVNKGVALKGSAWDKSRVEEEDFQIYTKLLSSRRYQENREDRLAYSKQWQKDNPNKCRVINQNRRIKRRELGGKVTLEELDALMEAQDYKCANCKDELTDENKHMDHIMPVILKGTGDIGNIQWLCDYCNLSKNDKHPDLWSKVVSTQEWWDIKALRQRKTNA